MSSAPTALAVAIVPLVRARALSRPFDYALDGAALPVGAVVCVPLGAREVRGVVVGAAAEPEVDRPLRVARDTGLRVPPDLVALALEIAARYGTSPARALELVLPPAGTPQRTLWVRALPGAAGRGARQTAFLDALVDGPLPLAAARAAAGATGDVVRRLAAGGLVEVYEPPAATASVPVAAPFELTVAQVDAVARLCEAIDAGEPAPILLHGVTGSGKTEIFLRGIERCLERGRRALLLVPEIALAPQTAARVAARFGSRVAVLHSALAPGARAAEYARIARGDVDVVVGPRSALFAPLDSIGLIVLDEEHDPAYKQESDPRYDARAVAVLRARRHGAAILMATATPRPETWHALERVELPARIGGRLPPIDIVDLRRDGRYPLSRPLHDALAAVASDGGRAVLLLNRRGEAPALHCRSCGRGFGCRDCDVSLTIHGSAGRLVCHHCGHREPIPDACPDCGAVDLARIGAGTERLESVVGERFPELRVLRLDADSTARKGSLERTLDLFSATDRSVLVGTQLVAKGHHFPAVRLAAAIDADVGLAQPDFRAEERTFALLVQLAGRAGREGTGGRVIVQTWDPESRVIRLAARHAVPEFLDGELRRREALGYPPFRRIVRVLATARGAGDAHAALRRLVERAAPLLGGDDLLGPAPLFRVRGRERAHVLVKSDHARRAGATFGALLADDAAALRQKGVAVVVDVDPQSL